ncbi:thioredoxin O, mitochondrial-like isoform X2 [Phoenix dactylifera]|uniref:Thioredoxin O, mitochondrial-like isoform X2 n=1 Tax=Phoenix dactylifera TaxID=42345 RepID=A0A8B9AYK6_PHODC|nr:thioredoxin O, mitochondrial-like isoform X2 [Phoenix dactylifera]
MGRGILLLRSSLLRPLLHAHLSTNPLPAQNHPPLLSRHGVLPSPPNASRPRTLPPSRPSSDALFLSRRPFSSSSSPSNIVLIGSEEALDTALTKVQDEKLPAIFYFTAVWCGPCRFISPIIEEMSQKFPHVTTYKIDIDLEGLGGMLSKLKIYSVVSGRFCSTLCSAVTMNKNVLQPTFHFFQNGQKAAEIVGADATKLKNTMEDLYKKD